MERRWAKSGLEVGTKVKISKNLLQEPEKAKGRIISCEYIGEDRSGILLDCKFKPAWGTEEPESYHYRLHVNWVDIWSNQVRVKLMNGSYIKAERILDKTTHY